MTRFWNNLDQTLRVKGLKIQITHKSLVASKPMGLKKHCQNRLTLPYDGKIFSSVLINYII